MNARKATEKVWNATVGKACGLEQREGVLAPVTGSGLPDWWPQCPWPESVWTMTEAEYVRAVPDPDQRTAISGAVMRWGWRLMEKYMIEQLKEHHPDVLNNRCD